MAHLAMFAYTAFYIGRLHELVPWLARIRIVFVLGLVSVLLALLKSPRRRNRVLAQREVQIVLALTALAVIVTPFGVWSGGSWNFLADTFSRVLVFFVLIVALATSRRAIEHLLWSVLVGVALLGIFTIGGSSIVTAYGERAYASATYDPNDIAMIMVCALPLAAFAAVALRGLARLLAAGVALVCLLAIVMTMSRGGFIGLIVVSVLLLFRLGTAAMAPRLIVLGAIVGVLVAAAPGRYWDLMSTIWAPTAGGEYVERGLLTRVDLWIHGLKLFVERPVMGVGIGMYEVAEGLSHGGRGKWSTAHNSFIQLATELGIVGLVLFVALLVLGVANARRAVQLARSDPRLRDLAWVSVAIETSLYVYIVEGFALSQVYSPMLYFLIGVATALRLEVERRRRPTRAAVARDGRSRAASASHESVASP